jgi:hypothetical protein
MEWLYQPRKQQLLKQLTELCKQQTEKTRNLNYGFRYKGETYAVNDWLPDFRYNRLHPDLVESANDYLQAQKDYHHEHMLVDNCITQALIKCKRTEDFFRVLPHQVLQPLKKRGVSSKEDTQHRKALSEEQVAEFKQTYAQALRLISASLVRRTLEI